MALNVMILELDEHHQHPAEGKQIQSRLNYNYVHYYIRIPKDKV